MNGILDHSNIPTTGTNGWHNNNNYSNGKSGINYDSNGNIISGSWNNNNLTEGYISPGSSGTRLFNLTTTLLQ